MYTVLFVPTVWSANAPTAVVVLRVTWSEPTTPTSAALLRFSVALVVPS